MTATATAHSILWPKEKNAFKAVLVMLAGAVLLSLAAQISIPWMPVPLTFQSVTVLLIAMVLGARLGTGAIALYLLAGTAGLPVFTGFSSGLAVLAGPTAGYLAGFLFAAFLCGYLVQKNFARNYIFALLTAFLGTVIIFGCGLIFLTYWTGSFYQAFQVGVMPFVITEPLKLLVLAAIIPRFWR